MTIHLPPDIESSIQAAVHSGHFASVDAAMTKAASMLLQQLKQEHAQAPGRPVHDAEETAFDVASRAGLIGCITGKPRSPTDLSTNPKHMEGFGRE